MCVHPGGKKWYAAGESGIVRAVDEEQGSAMWELVLGSEKGLKCVAIDGVGGVVAAGATDGTLVLADLHDGTVRHELIYHDAGATTPELLSVEQLCHLIREAGREPVERDTLYHPVVRDPGDPAGWELAPVGR